MLNTVNCFMGLLSAGINQTTYNLEELLSVDEWDMLYKNSMDQNVLPIIYEQLIYSGVFELADKLLKSKYNQLYEEAFAAIRYREMFREQMIAFTSSQIQRTEQFYEYYAGMLQMGLHPVIVKGIICRNLYPEPDLRPSGDEDIYVQLDEYPKLKQFLLKNGFALTEKSRSETMLEEIEFLNVMKGVLYEVHTTLMPRTSTFYDKHNVVFENAFENAVIEVINGHEIYTLEQTQHLFFLLSHLLKHFVAGGVGIRQLCDIIMFIKKYYLVINWDEFK